MEGGIAMECHPDDDLVARLRSADAAAFAEIVRAWSPAMLHVARTMVSGHAAAEEAVQETWLAVIRGLSNFQGRSSLRDVLHPRERGPAAGRSRRPDGSMVTSGRRWGRPDRRSGPLPRAAGEVGRRLDAGRCTAGLGTGGRGPLRRDPVAACRALDQLPARQRAVVGLRDVHGLSAEEVCDALGVSPANQRVLLHRGRARLRQLLEDYYQPADLQEART